MGRSASVVVSTGVVGCTRSVCTAPHVRYTECATHNDYDPWGFHASPDQGRCIQLFMYARSR
jgi:hypothetical protein